MFPGGSLLPPGNISYYWEIKTIVPQGLKIFFMNDTFPGGDERVYPVTISVKAGTVRLLSEMASDMGISIEDILSVLAEDAAIDLEHDFLDLSNTRIPDKCSTEDLLKALQ